MLFSRTAFLPRRVSDLPSSRKIPFCWLLRVKLVWYYSLTILMTDELQELMRIRERIAKMISEGRLSNDTQRAMAETLESVDRDIAALKLRRPN